MKVPILRVVLDTSVLVAAFRSRTGASNHVLQLAIQGSLEVVASTAVFLEYEQVLTRDHQRAVHGVPIEEIDRFLTALASRVHPVHLHFIWRPQLRDEKDEIIFEAALNGRAGAIVTHNVRDFLPAAQHFDIQVLTPASFLKQVK